MSFDRDPEYDDDSLDEFDLFGPNQEEPYTLDDKIRDFTILGVCLLVLCYAVVSVALVFTR